MAASRRSRPPYQSQALPLVEAPLKKPAPAPLKLTPYHGRNSAMNRTTALIPATMSPKLILDVSNLVAAKSTPSSHRGVTDSNGACGHGGGLSCPRARD